MDTRSKILVTIFVILLFLLSAFEYRQIVVKHDYAVKAHTPCDEVTQSCFKTICATEDDPDCIPEVYAKITKNVSNVELCNQYEREDCPDLACEPGESDCEILYCSVDTAESGESCVGPASIQSAEVTPIIN